MSGSTKPILRTRYVDNSPTASFDFPANYPTIKQINKNAILYIYKTLKAQSKKVTLLAIGPGTNIALLLKTFPDVGKYIEEIIFLGGAIGMGIFFNSEFNN